MSYSSAESKVSQVAALVGRAGHQLNTLLEQAEQIVKAIDRELAGAGEVVAEIDAQAATGDELWLRQKQRKDVVRDEIMAKRATAIAIRDDIQARLKG